MQVCFHSLLFCRGLVSLAVFRLWMSRGIIVSSSGYGYHLKALNRPGLNKIRPSGLMFEQQLPDARVMLHVKQIREIVDAGRNEDAHSALEQLLSLGPHNIEALKLRAQLFEFEGRFHEEAQIWERVLRTDPDDQDAAQYLMRRQIEEREHFYFTDDLPQGGRRFLAYPRKLISTSALGLLGCVAFLLATRMSVKLPFLADPTILLIMFGVLVLLPWVGIVSTYLSGIKYVSVSEDGVAIATRLKTYDYKWKDLERVCLAHSFPPGGQARLSLVFLPKDPSQRPIEIDLNQTSTAIRARSYLVREITRSHAEPEYTARDRLALDGRKVSVF